MKNLSVLMISILICGTLPSNAYAQMRDWSPGMDIELGGAWDPIFPDRDVTSRGCFEAAPSEERPGVISEIRANVAFVESQSELEKIRTASSKLSASGSYGGVSGSAKFSRSMSTRSLRSDSSVSWLFKMERTYAAQGTEQVRLTQEGKDAFANRTSSEQFFRRCGRGYVNAITKGVGIYVLYTAVGSTSENTEKIRQSVSAKISGTGGSVSAESNFSSSISKIDKYAEIHVDVLQRGAKDSDLHKIEQLALIRPGDLDALRTELAPVLRDVSYGSARTLRFDWEPITDILDLPDDSDRMFAFSLVEGHLFQLAGRLREVRLNMTALRALINSRSGDEIEKVVDSQPQLKAAYTKQEHLHDELLISMRQCRIESTKEACSVPWADEVALDVTDFLVKPFVEYGGWTEVSSVTQIRYAIRVGYQWEPIIKFRNTPAILELRVLKNGREVASLSPQDIDLVARGKRKLIPPVRAVIDQGCPRKRNGNRYKRCPRVADYVAHLERPKLRNNEAANQYAIEYVDMDGQLTKLPIHNAINSHRFRLSYP